MKLVTTYHAFTDGLDDWFDTLEQAEACINQWRAEGYQNLRIYSDESEPFGDMGDEEYIYGEGDFPY